MAMEQLPPSDDAKRGADGGVWNELKPDTSGPGVPLRDGLDPIDGPTFAQAPVLYIDGDGDAALKADSADLLALKSRRRRRPSEPATPPSGAAVGTHPPHSMAATSGVDASVAFSSFELSYVPPHEAVPVGVPVGAQYGTAAANPQYAPRASIPADNVGAFLQSLTLTFGGNLATVDFLRARLAEMGYDSIFALAFVTDHELAMAGIAFPQDQHAIRSCAGQEFAARRPQGPPGLYQMVTMSKWLMQCGIPRQMATVYTTQLQTYGYDNVQHFESIGHDSRALSIFRPGHYHLFKYFLERVLQHHQQHQQQQYANQGYGMYYGNTAAASGSSGMRPTAADDFNSTLLDDLVPSGFPLSPAVHGMRANPTTSMYQQNGNGYYPQPTAANNMIHNASTTFTDMMHDGGVSAGLAATTLVGPPVRPMKENELRLLYEAVNMDDKTNPCRRGKKVDWTVIATNGMGDPRFAVLAQYTAEELEQNYVQNHELPLHTNARNSEWSSELIKLLWKVSQDTRCKNGTKTMWEQIAQGRTGVAEYQPLAKFSNSQLRSRFRTEFGDKRPQSRKKARETKNALAKAAAMGLLPNGGAAAAKNGAKPKVPAGVKDRKSIQDENRVGLAGPSIPNGSTAI